MAKFDDPVVGTLAKSQKKKLDEMEDWGDNPFVEYQVKPVRGYFVFEKKHKAIAIACGGCKKRGHYKCSHKMCKKCCIKLVMENGISTSCKMKEHVATVVCKAKCAEKKLATTPDGAMDIDSTEDELPSQASPSDVMKIDLPTFVGDDC